MFRPTHVLRSRSRQTPVRLIPGHKGYLLQTEAEWENGRQPAFEMSSKLGFFCQGIPVVGYHLEPLAISEEAATATPSTATT